MEGGDQAKKRSVGGEPWRSRPSSNASSSAMFAAPSTGSVTSSLKLVKQLSGGEGRVGGGPQGPPCHLPLPRCGERAGVRGALTSSLAASTSSAAASPPPSDRAG